MVHDVNNPLEDFFFGNKCSCHCLFHVIVELHGMDEKMINDFLIEKWKWILYVSLIFFSSQLL